MVLLQKNKKRYIKHPLIVRNTIEARLYQEVAFAETVKTNSIVILPTGLGKTVIAALSTVYWLSQNDENKVIMFAPTRPLLDQHFNTFTNWLELTDSEIVQITGKTYAYKRAKMFNNARIIFMTPQIKLERFNLENVILMVLDECHRATGRYSYVLNAKKYLDEAKNPHILGLTATPGTPKKLLTIMKNLQIEKVTLASEDNPTVKPYIHSVTEQYIKIKLPDELMELRNFIDDYLKSKLNIIRNNPIISQYIKHKFRVSPHKLARIVKDHMGTMYSLRPKLMHILSITYLLNLIEAQSLKALEKKLTTLNSHKPIYNEIKSRLIELKRKGITHPKPEIATNIIQKFCSNNPESKVLVFVQYLDSLDIIFQRLRDKNLKVYKLVGQRTMQQAIQREVLKEFKSGKYQILICTSVAEEGLDIAQCDLVVFYDCIPSGIRTVQRKGRTGRNRDGKLVYLYTEGTWEESFFYVSRKRILDIKKVVKIMEKQKNPFEFLQTYLKNESKLY
ncbi:MAG: helicase-related protein [Candidatus Helarchaeota archaeon]